MNEIALQIIEIGKLIGKKILVKHYVSDGYNFSNDSEFPEIFTVEEYEKYGYDIINGKIVLLDIVYTEKFGDYYLLIFKNL